MEPPLLLDTEPAHRWLAQFAPSDRRWAELLVESLVLVSRNDLLDSLVRLVRQIHSPPYKGIALFAIREIDRPCIRAGSPLDPRSTDGTRAVRHGHFPPNLRKAAYFAQDACQSPDPGRPGEKVGSEGPIANLIRDIAQSETRGLLDHPSIDTMRACRCREALLIDDIVGSGLRSQTFVEGFCNHPTINSWLSLGYLSLRIVAYGATSKGVALVTRHRAVKDVVYANLIPPGSPAWSSVERENITRVCRAYALRTSRPMIPLGFRDAFTCTIFQDKCPNTAPAVLWAGSKTHDWRPLFPKRPSLGVDTWPLSVSPQRRERLVLEALRQSRLASGGWEHRLCAVARQRLLTLALAARRTADAGHLSALLSCSVADAQRLVADCVRFGWMGSDGRITGEGLNELDYARRLTRSRRDMLVMKQGFYFPKHLRMASVSI